MTRRGRFGPILPGRLAQRGYDVWLGNNRGVPYSDTHRRDGEWSVKEKWNFSWADMGQYDLPAEIDKILEVTAKPKLTYLGYSQGSSQAFYALAKNQDYYAKRIYRFVATAPCIYSDTFVYGFRRWVSEALAQLKRGIYNVSGRDEGADPEAFSRIDGGYPLKSLHYYKQILEEGRF